MSIEYPHWICQPCGIWLGKGPRKSLSTYHIDICGICKKEAACTEPRDFGHLKYGWEKIVIKKLGDDSK